MKKFILSLLISVFLFSCQSTLNKKISVKSFKSDIQQLLKHKDKNYTDNDYIHLQDRISNMIASNVLFKTDVQNETYKQVLDSVKFQRTEYEASLKNYNEAIANMIKQFPASIDSAIYTEYNYDKYYVAKVSAKNNAAKPINIIQGEFDIYYPADKKVKTISFKKAGQINAGQNIETTDIYPIISELDDDADVLKNIPFEKMKVIWVPQQIIFSDGKELTAPNKPLNPFDNNF